MRLLCLLITTLLVACSSKPTIEHGHLQKIETKALRQTLYYSGTIHPLQTVVIPSPADGVVMSMPLQYGDTVKSGQLLLVLSSGKFLTDYKNALMQYIKAKSDFDGSQSQLSEAEFLHKNLLISDDDYKTKKTAFYSSKLTLMQAKDSLQLFLQPLHLKEMDPDSLSITDIDKINTAFHLQKNAENLQVLSPATGILLAPDKNGETTKKITQGDLVKQGDALALIGDMSGLTIEIQVNELVINQLQVGQKVSVTGNGFPEAILAGAIKRIDRQGSSENGSAPMFRVDVVVPVLTREQQKQIHVGMSANLEIAVEESARMMIPLGAVKEKNGEYYVTMYDEAKNKLVDVAVKTGKTTLNAVAILSGIKPGDSIVVPD